MISSLKGQSFLALVILIGGIVAVIGVTLVFLSNTFVDSGYGFQASVVANAAAASGAEDALLQLDRNAAYPTGSYSLPVGSTTVTVTITQNSPSANLVTVLSQASISNHTGKVQVVLANNASTSQMSVVSWQKVQ